MKFTQAVCDQVMERERYHLSRLLIMLLSWTTAVSLLESASLSHELSSERREIRFEFSITQSVNSGVEANCAMACRVDSSVNSSHSLLEYFFLPGVLWKVE